MKSPFTGGEVRLGHEYREFQYRKDTFETLYKYYICVDTQERFTTTELDVFNMNHVHNEYRVKHGIPFVDEIKSIREEYGLSSSKMSQVLGFGPNVYRGYENGEMPSVANGRLIQLSKNPKEFRGLLNLCRNEFSSEEMEKIQKKIDNFSDGWNMSMRKFDEMILGHRMPNKYNGYKIPNIEKVGLIVQYFAHKVRPYKTKLNKLLFYCDFLHYDHTCQGITGLNYNAIQHGPVPNNYGSVYDRVAQLDYAKVYIVEFDGFEGEKFICEKPDITLDSKIFSDSEILVIELVANKLGKMSTSDIIEFSHEEYAWKHNVDEYNRINYDYGFYLNELE